nr:MULTISPECIES: pilus motility taxis protein HmpF [unclassified Leptolyngbya]
MYLAEVQKKGGAFRTAKVELRLLACQRSESSWTAVPNEEIVQCPDEMASYNAGALIMVELSGTKQIQRHSDAARQLVTILQNFSRLQDRSKSQEEEIEQWKESLTYQSQELNRREMELEARQEQLHQMEEDFERLEQQRREIEELQANVEQQRAEFDRKNQDLEGAWAHLRGEMNRMEEQKAQYSQSAVLDEGKAQQMQELLDRLSGAIAPTEAVREQLNQAFGILNHQQESIGSHYQTLDEERNQTQQRQNTLDENLQRLQTRWQEWRQAQTALEDARAELQARQKLVDMKQDHINSLTSQLQQQDELQQQFRQLIETSGQFTLGGGIDLSALEKMPLEELETAVRDMEADLEKISRFVSSQEEELTAQQDDINKLMEQIQSASEYDRMRMESELADEQDRYRMLDETLVGQRRTLQERRDVIQQHRQVLSRRKGESSGGSGPEIDLSPVVSRLDNLKQQLSQALQQAQSDLKAMQDSFGNQQGQVDQQAATQEALWNELQQQEQDLKAEKGALGEIWGRLNSYPDAMQFASRALPQLQENLEAVAGLMNQFQEASDYQLQAIAEMRQLIGSLTQAPEYAS